MKKALGILAVLSLASATFAADFSFWASDSMGGTVGMDAANTYNSGRANFLANVVGYDNTAPDLASFVTAGAETKTLFLWGRFGTVSAYSQLAGIRMNATTTGDLVIGQNIVYRHWKTNGPVSQQYRRWEDVNPIPVVNGTAAAVSAATGVFFNQPGDGGYDIYNDATGTFLLGVLEVTGSQGTVNFQIIDNAGATGAGLFYRDGDTGAATYDGSVAIGGGPELAWGGTAGGVRSGMVAEFVIPEPASLLLLALSSLVIRRR